jgi:hypothetical protein
MFRSDNNDSSGATGNYYYVDTDGDGKSSLIRFFDPSVGVEPVLVATTGGVVDSPNASTFQQIEHLAGQLDAVVPTVAALAGVPESNFRAGPNNVDLKTFGDILININNKYDTNETLSEFTKNKFQTKELTSNRTGTGGDLTELTFNNLIVGRSYVINLQLDGVVSATSAALYARATHDGVDILRVGVPTLTRNYSNGSAAFTATTSTLTFRYETNGSGSRTLYSGSLSKATLTELRHYEETTDFT